MSLNEDKKKKFPEFAERFNELRGEMSQVDFSNFIGIARATVGFYENGDRLPDALVLKKIAKKCNVSSDWLLGLSDVKKPHATVSAICQETGLSERAVDHLLYYHNVFSEDFSIQTLNLILEQAAPSPNLLDCFDSSDSEDKPFNGICDLWEQNGSLNILHKIQKYLSTNTKANDSLKILENGEIVILRDADKKFLPEDLYPDEISEINANLIIESILLDEIRDSIKKLKRFVEVKKMEGKKVSLSGNDHETR